MSSTSTDRSIDPRPRSAGLAICAAAPGAVLAILTLGMLAFAAAGRHPAWPSGRLSLAEAAALRDAAEVARQLESGADPNAAFPVRAGVLAAAATTITPLEAAVEARRGEIVSLLLARGAAPGDAEWTRLSCSARRRAPSIEQQLAGWRGGARAVCDD